MKKFYLYGKLGERFGREWSLSVKTVPEGIQAINANIPGFCRYLLDKELLGVNYIICTKPVAKTESKGDFFSPSSISSEIDSREVHIYPIVAGGVVFVPIGVALGFAGVMAGVVGFAVMVGASLLIGAIVNSLIDMPEMGDQMSTKSYVMNGPENTTRQGVPVPIGYGRLLVGSTVIQSCLRSFDLGRSINSKMLESFDQVQVYDLISEGPIEGLVNQNGETTYDLEQGVYLNGTPIKNLARPGDSQGEGSGTYNYVLNEGGTPTRLSRGEAFERLPLADSSAKTSTKYDELLVGPNPYQSEKVRTSIDSARSDEAVVITHYLDDKYTARVVFVLGVSLHYQTKDPEHPIAADTLTFGIRINDGTKYLTKADPGWGIRWRNQTLRPTSGNGTTMIVKISGIATSLYKFEIQVLLPKLKSDAGPRFVEIVRLTPETKPNIASHNYSSMLKHVMEEKIYQLSYPHCAIVNLNFDSKNLTAIPKRDYHVKLLKVPVPSNYTPETRHYGGHWDGLFKGQRDSLDTVASIPDKEKRWTDNPAWILYDLATNPRYGLAKYGVGVSEDLIDKWSLYKAAKYCDELVPTGYATEKEWRSFSAPTKAETAFPSLNIEGVTDSEFKKEYGSGFQFKGRKIILKMIDHLGNEKFIEAAIRTSRSSTKSVSIFSPKFEQLGLKSDSALYSGECVCQFSHPIVEPRYTCHLYITQFEQALELFKTLSGIFGAMVAYIDGRVGVVQEKAKESVMLFNSSNIHVDGFTYTGVDRFNRKTAVKVAYRSKYNDYKQSIAYEEDSPAIDRFGYNEVAITGIGVTSPAQAKRLARFFLYVSQLETEIVNFKCGREGAYLRAGEILEICDNNRQDKYSSGRIKAIDPVRRTLTLDRIVTKSSTNGYGLEFTVTNHQPNENFDTISSASTGNISSTEQDALIENVKSSQLSRFVGKINSSDTAYDLMSKKNFTVNAESQSLVSYLHGLKVGDKILFDSEGDLPEPYVKGLEYTVSQAFDNAFFVKLEDGDSSIQVSPITRGRDRIGNEGGLHYFINTNLETTTQIMQNIALGSPWAMSNNQLLDPKIGDSFFDRTGINSAVGSDNIPSSAESPDWFYSEIFKANFFSKEEVTGWLMIEGFGWIYIQDDLPLKADGTVETSGLDGFYYNHSTLGWVFYWRDLGVHQVVTNHCVGLKDKFFKILEEDLFFAYGSSLDGFDEAAGFFKTTSQPLTPGFFLSKANAGYVISEDHKTQVKLTHNSVPNAVANELDSLALPTVEGDSIYSTEPSSSYKNANNSGMLTIKIETSMHSIGKEGYLRVNITNQNEPWAGNGVYFAKHLESTTSAPLGGVGGDPVSVDVFLLVGAPLLSGLFTGGSFVHLDKKIKPVPLFTQKFRIKSIKEADEGMFEISASEYNPLKFKAIEDNINVEKPRAYIPPQANMAIPDAPENLNLIDLTYRP